MTATQRQLRLSIGGIAAAFLALPVVTAGAGTEILDADGQPDTAFPNFYAWYSAEEGVNGPGQPAEGAAVTTWEDRTLNDRDLVRVSASADQHATFHWAVANGLPAVEFDGNDYIWADSGTEFGTIQGPKTIFFVARVDVADGGYVFDGTTGSGRNACFTGQNADPARWHLFSGNGPVTVGPFVGTSVFQVHSVVFDTNANEHFLNGESISSGTSALDPLGGFILGSRYTVNFFLTGALAEVLVYDSVLSATDRQAIEGYLLEKHPVADPPGIPDFVDVFDSGDGLYDTYRIPSIITTSAGTLLAFAEGRATPSDHAENDIVMRRSTDGGTTWSPIQVLHDAGADSLNDPLALQVRDGPNAGRIILLYMRFPEGCHTNCVVPGYDGPNICRNYSMVSDDDGVTWTTPVEVTQQVRRESTNFAGTPGIGIQKRRAPHAGRLIFPLRQGPAGSVKMYALYSDDGGESWAWGDLVDDAQTPGGGDEVQMVELVDGSLLLNARSYSGTLHRKIARSADGGQTWTPLEDEEQLIEPQVMASVLRLTDPLDGYEQSRILYAGPNSQSARVNGTVHLSYDEGETWSTSRSIYPGAYAYSVLAVVDCATIGVLFERDNYQHISLARFDLAWLTEGEDDLIGKGDCAPCPADVNGDGVVAVEDLVAVIQDWGQAGSPADVDGDGVVAVGDLTAVILSWGPC